MIFERLRQQVEEVAFHIGLHRPEPELAVPDPPVVALPRGVGREPSLVVLKRWVDAPAEVQAAFEAELAEAQAKPDAMVVVVKRWDPIAPPASPEVPHEDARGEAQSAPEGGDISPVDCVAPEPILEAAESGSGTEPIQSPGSLPALEAPPPLPIWTFSRTGLSRQDAIDCWLQQVGGEAKIMAMWPWPKGRKE